MGLREEIRGRVRSIAALAAALAALAAIPATALAAWNQPVGGANPINFASDRSGGPPDLASIGGVPHVAWSETDA